MKRLTLCALLLLLYSSALYAAQIKVCVSGCAYDNNNLQTAMNAAVPGDEVLTQSGVTYATPITDGYVMGPQCAVTPKWDCITLRTGVSATGAVIPRTSFPPDGVRVDTAVYRGFFSKFIPAHNQEHALRTVYPGENYSWVACTTAPCVGSGWTVKWIEFAAREVWPRNALLSFGSNGLGKEDWNYAGGCVWPDPSTACWHYTLPNGDTQDRLVEVPRYLSVIQCDFHGDAVVGQHQGLLLASAETRVIGNSFRDFKSESETQAITGLNGIGPHTVENNYIEATGENTMWGGSDSRLQLNATVTGSPTSTVIALASPVWQNLDGTTTAANLATDMYSGIFISITHAGDEYGGVTCTLSGSTCTLSSALPFTPSVGDLVRWCWVAGGLTIRYNHYYKRPEWRTPAIPTPGAFAVTASTTGGSLSAGTYCYRVYAYVLISSTWFASDRAVEQCATVTSGTTGSVALSWGPSWATAPTVASGYHVHGRAAGAPTVSWDLAPSVTTMTDTGTATGSDTAVYTPNYWIAKNNFELKHCDGGSPAGACLIESNVIDYSWCCTQDNAVTIKIQDQHDGPFGITGDISATERNLTFRHNWVRHAGRALALHGADAAWESGTHRLSGVMTNVAITNNLFSGLNSQWVFQWDTTNGGSYNSAILMTTGNNPNEVAGGQCVGCSFIHNTFLVETNEQKGPFYNILNNSAWKLTDFVVRDNIMARNATVVWQAAGSDCNCYGFQTDISDTRQTIGTTSWTAGTQGASTAHHNAWPEGNSSEYSFSTSSQYPSWATLQGDLVNSTTCAGDGDITSCGVKATSALHHAASDGTDIGIDAATMQAGIAIALSGDTTGGGTPPPAPTTGGLRMRLRLRGGGAR